MKTVHHLADSRGNADHGWLHSRHTFSFADYHDPRRMGFGALRVLNDDSVAGGAGFGAHPHRNMEIISIPLQGDLAHKDSMGNGGIIRHGDIQAMSAGTGVIHSEINASPDKIVKFLQIWVTPGRAGVEPRYQQITMADQAKRDDFQQILSPDPNDEGVWIHQDAWFSLARFNAGTKKTYHLHRPGNGVYAFVIEGRTQIGDTLLRARDGLGIWQAPNFELEALSDAEVLLMEVPMQVSDQNA